MADPQAAQRGVELVLLKCVKCGTLVPAGEEEAAWACANCGQGLLLQERGLVPITVSWAAARPGAQARWLPFWVFAGVVRFSRRETYGRTHTDPDDLWDAPRRFFVPAFSASLPQLQALGAALTREQPRLTAGPAHGAFSGCTLFPADARHVVEFVVLTVEANRRDRLKTVAFDLDLQPPELWLLPFAGEPDARNLAL